MKIKCQQAVISIWQRYCNNNNNNNCVYIYCCTQRTCYEKDIYDNSFKWKTILPFWEKNKSVAHHTIRQEKWVCSDVPVCVLGGLGVDIPGCGRIWKLLQFRESEADRFIFIISITPTFKDKLAKAFILIVCDWTEASNACQTAALPDALTDMELAARMWAEAKMSLSRSKVHFIYLVLVELLKVYHAGMEAQLPKRQIIDVRDCVEAFCHFWPLRAICLVSFMVKK